jgi:hypothetical protein
MNSTVIIVWAGGWLAVTIAVALAARRIGAARAAAWLVLVGLFLLTLEEPALTLWLAISRARADNDGMATLITPMARAHVLDAATTGVAAALLLGCIAMTAFRRGERWAHRILRYGFLVAAATEAATTLFVFSRGLSLPGPGGAAGSAGFGWQPVAVGLLAWGSGLWLARAVPAAAEAASHHPDGHGAEAARQR